MMTARLHTALRALVCVALLLLVCRGSDRTKGQKMNSREMAFVGEPFSCAITLGRGLQESYRFGFNYEIVNEFAETYDCPVTIHAVPDTVTTIIDSLRKGVYDIIIIKQGRTDLDLGGLERSPCYDGEHIWVARHKDRYKMRVVSRWLGNKSQTSEEFKTLQQLFKMGYNPYKRAAAGIRKKIISPYDELVKKYAKEIGWDWRMLSALIYTESKFTINNVSRRGAVGLMQVMPLTGSKYGFYDLMDPEENIQAGTQNLQTIQSKYFSDIPDLTERAKFTLGAYNAGVGRITDCRRLARELGVDDDRWESIVDVIALMRDKDIVSDTDAVHHGVFKGGETIAYVSNVMSAYAAFCTICPR